MKKDVERLNKFKQMVGTLFSYKVVNGCDPNNNEKYMKKYEEWCNSNKLNVTFDTFDWKYYTKRYDDLFNAKINSKEKAWEHWKTFGEKELRSCNPKNDIVNKGQWGCLYSHINVLKDAIKNNYESILILEDDIILLPFIEEKFKKLHNFVNLHDDWNIIYLGVSQHNWENIKIKNNYYNANYSTGTFAYMVNRKFYRILLNEFIKMKKPVDNYLVDIQKIYNDTIYVIYPNIIICNLEESNIGKKRINKEFFKKFRWDI